MSQLLMVQGCGSGVGKSLLVAGLCRMFRQDGLRVAPFKSQNMALNSFVTPDGLEIGRAQALQAYAAGIEPSSDMNPILLKPTGEQGSQVILHGRSIGTMPAAAYYKLKKQLLPEVLAALDRLRAQYDLVLIEGAGSPAEINLRRDDLVNMGLALRVNAPVLLVGDIDCGGVFAALHGTLELLAPEERALVRGLIINKFRGDRTLLEPGLAMLETLTGKPVAGVVPFLPLDLEEEDSQSGTFRKAAHGIIDIAVIQLPHLSNFTDFDVLARMTGVGVRYVGQAHELGRPDLLILPGSKQTMADLSWLRASGLERAILPLAAGGTPLLGICGGYQMLGTYLDDPDGIETGGSMVGLGLLPVRTVFARSKRLARTCARFAESGTLFGILANLPVEGYEIHMGDTEPVGDALPLLIRPDGSPEGCQSGTVGGCYLHGLLDGAEVCTALVRMLAQARGLDVGWVQATDARAHRDSELDRLAAHLRQSLTLACLG